MRMVAYPHISTYDIFVHESSGQRFVIREVTTVAEIRGIPLVLMAEFRLAPITDMVYNIPIVPPTPPYSEGEPEPVAVDTDEFLGLPPAPPVPAAPVAPPDVPTPPVVLTEVHIPVAPKHAIWWDGQDANNWFLGATIGEEETALYGTTEQKMNPYFIPGYNWQPIKADPVNILHLTNTSNGFIITCSEPGAAGTYLRAGTYCGMFVYLQQ
jgi:hypothetical protein